MSKTKGYVRANFLGGLIDITASVFVGLATADLTHDTLLGIGVGRVVSSVIAATRLLNNKFGS